MTTEAENLARRLHDSHGGQSCAAIDMIQKQAAEIKRLTAEADLFARHIGLKLEHKDALLRRAWSVIRWQCLGKCRTPGVDGLPTASEVSAEIKEELGELK